MAPSFLCSHFYSQSPLHHHHLKHRHLKRIHTHHGNRLKHHGCSSSPSLSSSSSPSLSPLHYQHKHKHKHVKQILKHHGRHFKYQHPTFCCLHPLPASSPSLGHINHSPFPSRCGLQRSGHAHFKLCVCQRDRIRMKCDGASTPPCGGNKGMAAAEEGMKAAQWHGRKRCCGRGRKNKMLRSEIVKAIASPSRLSPAPGQHEVDREGDDEQMLCPDCVMDAQQKEATAEDGAKDEAGPSNA